MKIPIVTRIKCLFARDKFEFWFNEFTDEEKKLQSMDVWQLASVIDEATSNSESRKKRIVAEHMLNVRLAKIGALPGYIAIITGIIGIIGGAFLTSSLQGNQQSIECICECQQKQNIKWDIPIQIEPITSNQKVNVQQNQGRKHYSEKHQYLIPEHIKYL